MKVEYKAKYHEKTERTSVREYFELIFHSTPLLNFSEGERSNLLSYYS